MQLFWHLETCSHVGLEVTGMLDQAYSVDAGGVPVQYGHPGASSALGRDWEMLVILPGA